MSIVLGKPLTHRTSARYLDQRKKAMLVYFGSCVVSAVLLRLPHLACEAGENDIGSCLCQEEQNAEKIDPADAT
jgi:hypothetical protein